MRDKNKMLQLGDLINLKGLEKREDDVSLRMGNAVQGESSEKMSVLAQKLEGNEAVKVADLGIPLEDLKQIKVDYFGDLMSYERYDEIEPWNRVYCHEIITIFEHPDNQKVVDQRDFAIAQSAQDLTYLPVKVARVLKENVEKTYFLNHLKQLSVEAAAELVQSKARIDLDGLEEIDLPLAEVLGQHQGDLSLGSLSKMDVDVAEALAGIDGALRLGGLTDLSPEVAAKLAAKKGGLSLYIKELDEKVAEALSAFKYDLLLGNVKKISPEVAKILVRGSKHLWLGIKQIDVETARELAKLDGRLEFYMLEAISPEVAKELAAHEMSLDILGLKSFGPAQARLFDKENIHLDLCEVKRMSDETLTVMANWKSFGAYKTTETLNEEMRKRFEEIKAKIDEGQK